MSIKTPQEGGCWYCCDDNRLDLVFCHEFDTFVHLNCVREAVSADPNDQEAQIIAAEVLSD